MREHPILFSGAMVRALLAGTKTQTRRILRSDLAALADQREAGGLDEGVRNLLRRCPYGAPGDRLWVRETFATDVLGCPRGVSYRADHRDPMGDGPANPMTWRPSIHMPRWASRLARDLTGVRMERLHDITEADARAEGVEGVLSARINGSAYRTDFARLWEQINGKRAPWASNPWVWVVTFARSAP